MYILHIDTSGPQAIVMMARDGVPVGERRSEGEREHAGAINRLIAEATEESGIALKDIDAVAVCNGPGSYTGLRIGLATAKGLCYALDKPLILHSRLDLLMREAQEIFPDDAVFLAILPARAGEYYFSFSAAGSRIAPTHAFAENVETVIRENPDVRIIGDADTALAAHAGPPLISHTSPDPLVWARAGFEAFKAGTFANTAYAVPEYLKAAFTTTSKKGNAI